MIYQPFLEIEALYNFGDTSGVTVSNPTTVHTDGWRGRLKAGVSMTTEGGARFGFSGIYDGIGRDDFESFGVSVDVEIPFYKAKAR